MPSGFCWKMGKKKGNTKNNGRLFIVGSFNEVHKKSIKPTSNL
jgi:hypothetical protein